MKASIGGRAYESIRAWRGAGPAHMAVSKEVCVQGSILHLWNRELVRFRLTMWLIQAVDLSLHVCQSWLPPIPTYPVPV